MRDSLHRVRRRAFLARAARRSGANGLAAFGPHSLIVPPATILCPHRVFVGDHVLIHERVTFSLVEEHRGRRYEPRLSIGDGSLVARDVWFSCVGTIQVGARVLIGHGVVVSDSFHEYAGRGTPILDQPMAPPGGVRIGDGASVGPGAAILPGAAIGRGAYVAANAVVAGTVPPHSVVAGNPAEVIRRWDTEAGWIDSEDPRWAATLTALSAPSV